MPGAFAATFARLIGYSSISLGNIRLLDLMGGGIQVQRGAQQGSRFEVRLPLQEPDGLVSEEGVGSDQTLQTAASGSRLGGISILVAEDNESNRVLMEDMRKSRDSDFEVGADAAATEMSDSELQAFFSDLEQLLAADDTRAIGLFEEHEMRIPGRIRKPISLLSQKVSMFEFESALIDLRKLKADF